MTHAAIIYSHSITPRLTYLVDFLSRYYGVSFKLTSDETAYVKADTGCRINYSYHAIAPEEIWIHPHALLFESAVHEVKIECFTYHKYKVFFKTEGHMGFDLFAGIFYLISRYEEHLPHKTDAYGRYAHENALAHREGFLQLPLVNYWLEDFRSMLAGKNEAFQATRPDFHLLPTYDIDMAWSYCHKGFQRNAGALLQSFLSGKWRRLSERVKVLRKKIPDPFDAYDWMDELHRKHGLEPVYFFLVAHHRGKYDRNISTENPAFRQLIQETAARYPLGLHPSWASGDHPFLLPREKRWLEQLTHRPVHASRQHFIRFQLPQTYRYLAAAGITDEYSMGYGSTNGFRASIASSYYWYDLKHEESTSLLLHPFCFMDATAYYEQGLDAEQAFVELMQYYKVTREVGGRMITIWHNSFLGTDALGTVWKDTYQRFLETISETSG
ncbi:MAG: polysaccharide deacetylase family protein [Flavisolibacter sp.]